MSHLAEHRRAVNRLALTGNGQLLLSASDDETVKVCILPTMNYNSGGFEKPDIRMHVRACQLLQVAPTVIFPLTC